MHTLKYNNYYQYLNHRDLYIPKIQHEIMILKLKRFTCSDNELNLLDKEIETCQKTIDFINDIFRDINK